MAKKKEIVKEIVKEIKTETAPNTAETPAAPVSKAVNDLLIRKLAAQAKLIKKYNAVGGSASGIKPPNFYPTGLDVFDNEVIGIGGLPQGRMIEVYGPKSSGKTALAMYLAGAAQKLDPSITIKIYDIESSFTRKWGQSMGLDVGEETDDGDEDFKKGVQRFGRTTVVRGLSAEEVAAMIKEDLSLGELTPNIIIIDSVAVLNPEQVMKKDNEDLSMNDNYALAKFLTEFLKSVTGGWYWPPAADHGKAKLSSDAKKICLADTNTTMIHINHAKAKTISQNGRTWTEWEHVGGKALDFHCALQFMVTRMGFVEDMLKKVSHQKIKVCADKNKLAPPKRECMLLLDFKGGISQLGTIDWLSIAINKGLATKDGAWIKSAVLLPNDKIQGAEAFNKFIDGNKDTQKLLVD